MDLSNVAAGFAKLLFDTSTAADPAFSVQLWHQVGTWVVASEHRKPEILGAEP